MNRGGYGMAETSAMTGRKSRVNKETAWNVLNDFSKPDTLNWDLYLGPAQEVPFHPIYHPFNWRGWVIGARAHWAIWART